MQYYNSLFPPITSTLLPAFDAIPQSKNGYTNINNINYLKFPFYHSIANARHQYKSVVVSVTRADNNINPVDKKIFNAGHIFFKAVDKSPENQVITDQTGETYINIPSTYFINHDFAVASKSNLPLGQAEGKIAFTFADNKTYIVVAGQWAEINQDNYKYPSIEDLRYKVQLRLMPYEIRKKSDNVNWEALVGTTWKLIDEQFFKDNRDFVSEYSTVTTVDPSYKAKVELPGGGFKQFTVDGEFQPPVYNKDDNIVGDGINDSVNIITSSFFQFIGSYFNQYDMQETISKYKFIIKEKTKNNPLEEEIVDESETVIVPNPELPSIVWQNKVELENDKSYWVILETESKNGLKTATTYWTKAVYSKMSGSAGLELEPDNELGRIKVKIDGTQILFVPKDSEPTHVFIGGEEAKFTKDYVTSRDIELNTVSGEWCSQVKVRGITPNTGPFLTISSEEISPSVYTQYIYELSAVYYEQTIEYNSSDSQKFLDISNQDRYRIYIDTLNRLSIKDAYTQGSYLSSVPLKDIGTSNKYWLLSIADNRMQIEETSTSTQNTSLSFTRGDSVIDLKIENGRIVLDGGELGTVSKKYVNQFVWTKKILEYDVMDKESEQILQQDIVARFFNPATNQMEDFDKIGPEDEYYFYVGDNQGFLTLYAAQIKDGNNIPSYDNE